jgi:hypothetical protein
LSKLHHFGDRGENHKQYEQGQDHQNPAKGRHGTMRSHASIDSVRKPNAVAMVSALRGGRCAGLHDVVVDYVMQRPLFVNGQQVGVHRVAVQVNA